MGEPSEFDSVEPPARELSYRFGDHADLGGGRAGELTGLAIVSRSRSSLRPEYAPKTPEDRAQCDPWSRRSRVLLGGTRTVSPPVTVLVSSLSRFNSPTMTPSRQRPDLVARTWSLVNSQLGAVSRRLSGDKPTGEVRAHPGCQRLARDLLPARTRLRRTGDFHTQPKCRPEVNLRRVLTLDAASAELIGIHRRHDGVAAGRPMVGFSHRARYLGRTTWRFWATASPSTRHRSRQPDGRARLVINDTRTRRRRFVSSSCGKYLDDRRRQRTHHH